MPRSMTGFGRASREGPPGQITVEVKSVNHRYLKVQSRMPPLIENLDGDIENRIRERLSRGAIQVVVDLKQRETPLPAVLDPALARTQLDRIEALWKALFPNAGPPEPARAFESLMRLPLGQAVSQQKTADEIAPLVLETLGDALDALEKSRELEGGEIASALLGHRAFLSRMRDKIAAAAPAVIKAAQTRYVDRINQILAEVRPGLALDEEAVLRESGIYAERGDITEELARLAGHLGRFDDILRSEAEVGRRLEFLLQEMLREANTIGSKSLDLGISHEVVEIKAEIEKMKEQVQNLE